MRAALVSARKWYAKYERPFSSISLIGGFVFDAVTLKRVDMFWENFWVVAHLLIVAVCIVWLNWRENSGGDEANPEKAHFWLVNVMQFFFGGILSTYLVFYFRSGTIATSWPFLLILAAAFFANESFKRHYARLTFQVSLFFLAIFSFAIFLVPILFHTLGPRIFLISGGASVVFILLFIVILRIVSGERFALSRKPLYLSLAGIFAAMNLLYFYNLIPPIPLSLKDGGVYHSLVAMGPGRYTIQYEAPGPFDFLRLSDRIHLVAGDPLYAYSAVFSPTALNTDIIHEWQWYDPASGAWVTKGRILLSVVGGRDGGYRTFSMEPDIAAGAWRVNVLTPRNEVIGRLRFDVTPVPSEPPLVTDTVD